MKHNPLRRLSAFALALVMAASLCVSPAWADDPAPDPAPSAPSPLTLSTRLIMLKDAGGSYNLTVGGLSKGETVTLSPQKGATINGAASVYSQDITEDNVHEITVPVGASADVVRDGVITVSRTKTGTPDPVGASLNCYVYSGYAPFTYTPEPLSSITAGQSTNLTLTINEHQELFTESDVRFTSGDENYATVSVTKSGSSYIADITGVSPLTSGTVPITMTLTGGYQKTWDLRVDKAPDVTYVNLVQLTPNTLTLTAGDTYTFNASNKSQVTILPDNATDKTLEWRSSDEGIATVDQNGKITAKAAGTTVITATPKVGTSTAAGRCTVTVKESASDATLNETNVVLNLASTPPETTARLRAIPTGENSGNTSVTWRSSNTSIATVSSDGLVTGLKAGSATITATVTFKDANGKTTATKYPTCVVTVLDDKSTPITSMTLSESSHTMPADGNFTLSVRSVTPANAPVKTVTWSSSDEDVIKVDEKTGAVTAVGAGQAAVIATAAFGGAQAICVVTVTEITDMIRLNFGYDTNTPIGSNKYTYTFKSTGNDYIPVTAVLSPTGTYGAADPVHWVSKNTSVVTVPNTTSTKTVITAAGPGRTTVTAIPMDPSKKDREAVDPAEITITVSGVTIVNDSENAITSLTLMPDRRQTVQARAWGSAYTGDHSVDWTSSDPSVVTVNPKSGESTILTARSPGTATISARKGSYMATCTVTVTEDTVGLITASTPASTAYQFSKLLTQLQNACRQKTDKELAYITNLSVSSTDQGVLYDLHHSSEDTGAGVGLQDRYYPGTAPQGQRSLNDLSFVPKNTFSGTAEISYTAWSTDNKSFSGVIHITVNGTGDVAYSSDDGSPVAFSAEDFNFYHPNLRSVSFTLPQANVGTLYYNYNSASHPGTKVTATDTYSRSGNPSLDRVTFVPTAGYTGTVKISYKGTDTAGRAFTGTVTITVGQPSGSGSNTTDIYYDFKQDGWVTFRATDFSTACQRTLGESLSYVRFTPPPSSDGTLFYNYRGFSNFDSMVASTTSYYYSGTPALSGVSFVPITTTPGQVDIAYTGYTTRGNTFTGTVHIGQANNTQQTSKPRYTVVTGQSVSLRASDFNTLCLTATNASLSYIQFTQLPAVSQGTLRFTRSNNTTSSNVTTGTRFYYTNTGTVTELIGNVYFQAGSTIGTVTIPFIGYNTNGVSFTDEITIQITPPTTTFSGTNSSPFRLTAAQIRSAVSGSLSGTLSYITFTSLPNATAGRLYSNYNGFGTGSQVNTGTPYYASGSPSIDQLSFVPRGRSNGTVTIGYTATNTTGQSVSGQLVFNISNSGNSKYFNDLIYCTWAAPSVDYLYENRVTKGVTATSYAPNQQIQRGDFVLMLVRALSLTGSGGYSFPDVATTEYFASAVAIAKQRGVVNGDNGYFKPYSPVTRQDAMVIIKNALAASGRNLGSGSTSILNTFSDGSTVSSYARDAVSTLVQLGAVTGDNGRLLPHNPITRAEAAVILHFVMTM